VNSTVSLSGRLIHRAAIHDSLNQVFGDVELVLDLPHNTYQIIEDGGLKTVKRELETLRLAGRIEFIGPSKTGTYQLVGT
ncbi:MAG: hypothetical protein ACKOAH_29090, partial [Pirellula sp.]